jgi:hypothetical protein
MKILYGMKIKTCIIFEIKINVSLLDGRKIKYVFVALISLPAFI